MQTPQDDLRRDLDAAVHTRQELGKEYEPEIIDSFLSRLDARLDARVEQRVSEELGRRGSRPRGGMPHLRPVLSLIFAIPLSGIAAGTSGFVGLVVCWAGIVAVNVSAAVADKRVAAQRPARSEWA